MSQISNPSAAAIINSIPFRPDTIESMDCKQNSDGTLACQIGLFGAKEKTNMTLRGTDLKKIQCGRDANGVLVCTIDGPHGQERVIF